MTWKVNFIQLHYPKVKSKMMAYEDFLGVILCLLERAVEKHKLSIVFNAQDHAGCAILVLFIRRMLLNELIRVKISHFKFSMPVADEQK